MQRTKKTVLTSCFCRKRSSNKSMFICCRLSRVKRRRSGSTANNVKNSHQRSENFVLRLINFFIPLHCSRSSRLTSVKIWFFIHSFLVMHGTTGLCTPQGDDTLVILIDTGPGKYQRRSGSLRGAAWANQQSQRCIKSCCALRVVAGLGRAEEN